LRLITPVTRVIIRLFQDFCRFPFFAPPRRCVTLPLFPALSGLRYLDTPSVHHVLPLSSEQSIHNQGAKKKTEEQEQTEKSGEGKDRCFSMSSHG
jgi:hypothetical protein